MWENAAPLPENEPPRPPARCAGSEEELVLWAQILLCLAAIGLVLAAGALDWPVYPELRRVFTAAMQPEQSLLLGEERNLLKFTEQTAGELADSARSMWEDFTLPATPESARTAHGQPSPPAYARTDSYTPGFPLQFPLPGQSRKTSGYGWRTDPMGGLGDDTSATTWLRHRARRCWPPRTVWCAWRAAIRVTATTCAFSTPTATRRCTRTCSICS